MHKKNLTNQGVVIFTIGSDYPEHNGYKFVTCVFYTEEKYKNSCQQWWNDIPESSLSDERYFSETLGEAAEIHYKKVEEYKDIKEDDDFDFTEDYCILHRPTSNGKGWVMIAPGEKANNHYTEDPVLVKFLYKKFKVNEQV